MCMLQICCNMKHKSIVFLIFVSFWLNLTSAQQEEEENCKIRAALQEHGHILLSEILPCQYQKEYPPPQDVPDSPVDVECALFVQDINSINPADMDFRVDLILHMSWVDKRLDLRNIGFLRGADDSEGYIALPSYSLDYLWVPDPYITNSKDSAISSLTTVYASVSIHSNHTIRYSAKAYSLVACQMSFQKYPMDVQICPLSLQSFKYSSNEVTLRWRQPSAVTLNPDLKLLQFAHRIIKTYAVNSSTNDYGGYGGRPITTLKVELAFSRLIGHHIVQTYMPSFLIVALSWFSFYMGLDAIPGRVTLLVTCLLTLTTLFTGIKNDLPGVAYIKAIDIWMAGCIFFAFAAMGEFILCKIFSVYMEKENNNKKSRGQSSFNRISADTAYDNHSFTHDTQSYRTTYDNNDNHRQFSANHFGYNNLRGIITSKDGGSHKEWPAVAPGDVEMGRQGLTAEKRTHTATKHIDVAYSVAETGSIPNGVNGSASTTHLTTVIPDYNSTPPVVVAPPTINHHHPGRGKWLRTLKELQLQWDDPVTGDQKILWEEIDRASRIVFPLFFFVFSLVYFPALIMV